MSQHATTTKIPHFPNSTKPCLETKFCLSCPENCYHHDVTDTEKFQICPAPEACVKTKAHDSHDYKTGVTVAPKRELD